MKTLISTLAVSLVLAFTVPAFAGDIASAKTQTDCQKAGGVWETMTARCSAPMGE